MPLTFRHAHAKRGPADNCTHPSFEHGMRIAWPRVVEWSSWSKARRCFAVGPPMAHCLIPCGVLATSGEVPSGGTGNDTQREHISKNSTAVCFSLSQTHHMLDLSSRRHCSTFRHGFAYPHVVGGLGQAFPRWHVAWNPPRYLAR